MLVSLFDAVSWISFGYSSKICKRVLFVIASHHFSFFLCAFQRVAKTPASGLKRAVSSSPTHKAIEDEVIFLRSQNKMLKSALNAVKDTAKEKLSKSYELVWYARNRSKNECTLIDCRR